jgi:hypothetical protein
LFSLDNYHQLDIISPALASKALKTLTKRNT